MESLEKKAKEFLTVDWEGIYGGSSSGNGLREGCGDGGGFAIGYGALSCISENYHYQNALQGILIDKIAFVENHSCICGRGNFEGHGSGQCAPASCVGISDIKEINGGKIYVVDDTLTIFSVIRGNVAKGFLVHSDLQLTPCYIVKDGSRFAHGKTLREAYVSLRAKKYDDSTEEERIEVFKKKFPNFDQRYTNRDFFAYHHVLTGSCKMGREHFVKERGLSLDGQTTVREFVNLTKNTYGGEIIRKLPMAYHVVIE